MHPVLLMYSASAPRISHRTAHGLKTRRQILAKIESGRLA